MPKNIIVRRELIVFCYEQNKKFGIAIFSRYNQLLVVCAYVFVVSIIFAFYASQLDIATPLIEKKDGTYEQIEPLYYPQITTIKAIEMADKYAVKLLSLGFNRFNTQLDNIRPLFLPGKYQEFENRLVESGILQNIYDNNLSITAVTLNKSRLVKDEIIDGKLNYTFAVKVMQTSENLSGSPTSKSSTLYLTLQRSSRDTSPDGLLIRSTGITK